MSSRKKQVEMAKKELATLTAEIMELKRLAMEMKTNEGGGLQAQNGEVAIRVARKRYLEEIIRNKKRVVCVARVVIISCNGMKNGKYCKDINCDQCDNQGREMRSIKVGVRISANGKQISSNKCVVTRNSELAEAIVRENVGGLTSYRTGNKKSEKKTKNVVLIIRKSPQKITKL